MYTLMYNVYTYIYIYVILYCFNACMYCMRILSYPQVFSSPRDPIYIITSSPGSAGRWRRHLLSRGAPEPGRARQAGAESQRRRGLEPPPEGLRRRKFVVRWLKELCDQII